MASLSGPQSMMHLEVCRCLEHEKSRSEISSERLLEGIFVLQPGLLLMKVNLSHIPPFGLKSLR